ncbi:cupin domain-containing protein [Streptomyces sp. NPDC001858]
MTAPGFVSTEADGTAVWYMESLMTVLASAEDTDGKFGVLEVRAKPGMAGPLHIHHKHDEAFYVLEGRVKARCGDDVHECGPGSFIWLPHGIPHQVNAVGDTEVRMLEFSLPGGIEGFHREAGVPAETRTVPPVSVRPDMDELRGLAAKYDVEIVGPPPARAG